jgi:hypothetical protein
MDQTLETVYNEVDHDLSAEWLKLSARVKALSGQISARAKGTLLAEDTMTLAEDTAKLCEHLECIHRDVGKLLVRLDEELPEMDFTPTNADDAEIQKEAIQIHRESHELRADFKDIIKALFMWQDDPAERVRGKH